MEDFQIEKKMEIYLVTYKPMCFNKIGQAAIEAYKMPPFVDASCRREPDLQSTYPSITALCRGVQLAPRLKVDDIVSYIAKIKNYLKFGETHWRLTAALKVIKRFETHKEAAQWYMEKGLPLPGNCMVVGNEPLPIEMTIPYAPPKCKPYTKVKAWDAEYKKREMKWGVFLVCEPLFLSLDKPPIITRKILTDLEIAKPGRRPVLIKAEQFSRLSGLFI